MNNGIRLLRQLFVRFGKLLKDVASLAVDRFFGTGLPSEHDRLVTARSISR
ncbi:hypothetical protein NKH48_03560 [Mesorhizobium sp. M1233]|uniref:hypothetical protein n=1 Tax=Mesorhizobium sp. M1233 TaxID=2957072 RepID=UPI00333DC234